MSMPSANVSLRSSIAYQFALDHIKQLLDENETTLIETWMRQTRGQEQLLASRPALIQEPSRTSASAWQQEYKDRMRIIVSLFYQYLHQSMEGLATSSPVAVPMGSSTGTRRGTPTRGSNSDSQRHPSNTSNKRILSLTSPSRPRSPHATSSPSASAILARAGSGVSNESPTSLYLRSKYRGSKSSVGQQINIR